MTEFAAEWMDRVEPYFAQYGGWFVLVVLFLKSLPFVGAPLPGAVLLVAAGAFARQEKGGIAALLLAGFAGTVAGDAVCFWVGRKAGGRLVESKRWGHRVAELSWRLRGEPALIFFCHFETILRMLVPITAGISRLPFRRWLLLDAAGVAVWVVVNVGVGYFLSFANALAAGRTIALVALALIVLWLIAHWFQKRLSKSRPKNGDVTQGGD